MAPDPAGRRTPRGTARGVATVPPLRPAVQPAGTVYVASPQTQPGIVARVVLAVAGMTTGIAVGGLLFGQALASWMGV